MNTVAATRAAVILNCNETSGPHSNGIGYLKVHFRGVYKIFWRSKGGFARTPSNPPCLRACHVYYCNMQSALFSKALIHSLSTVQYCSNFEWMLHQILCKVEYSWNHLLSCGYYLQREQVPVNSKQQLLFCALNF